ncbi:MAG: type VI secretion system tip protein VgrG, partial [Myxococcales bacterium]|nr:type VI secretion system tip protein VgrG [Myxococcales bacterium]
LLEEEGISYEFRHDEESGKETLVLHDGNGAYEPLANIDGAADVPCIENEPEQANVESIQNFEWLRRMTSTAVLRRDFDWTTPSDLLTEPADGEDDRGRVRRVYIHGQRRYINDDLSERSKDAQEAALSRGQRARGRSNVSVMRPGLRFSLTNHDRSDLLREYLIVDVVHRGADRHTSTSGVIEGGYHNEFECIPVDVVARPERRTARPTVRGPQTATVTGASGDEICTDEHGRIRVQFHWEEQPKYDDTSSCWVRCAQSWAGPSWGAQFIPRVGMEVVVEFLDGNPDRPLVTGCVYNGNNPPPFALPDHKTQSGWRTNSSPGGGGSNELRFEDA